MGEQMLAYVLLISARNVNRMLAYVLLLISARNRMSSDLIRRTSTALPWWTRFLCRHVFQRLQAFVAAKPC